MQDGHIDYAPTIRSTDPFGTVGGEWSSVSTVTQEPVRGMPGKFSEVWALDSFSAHCWHTFSELSSILSNGDDTLAVPLGLIESAWCPGPFLFFSVSPKHCTARQL